MCISKGTVGKTKYPLCKQRIHPFPQWEQFILLSVTKGYIKVEDTVLIGRLNCRENV